MTDQHTKAAESLSEGLALFAQGEWAAALNLADEAVALEASSEEAHLLRARCLMRLQAWMPARAAFAQALRLNVRNYSAWMEAGHLCRQMGELQQAAMSYQRAIDVSPDRYEGLLEVACVLVLQGHFEAADKAYADALPAALKQGMDALYETRQAMGQCWLAQGQAERALRCFEGALALPDVSDASRAQTRIDGAAALLRMGQRKQALRWLSQASAATDEASLLRLTMLTHRCGMPDRALALARGCVALYPRSVTGFWQLACLLTEAWQFDEAERMLRHAEGLGAVPQADALRAMVARHMGEPDMATALFVRLAKQGSSAENFASQAAVSSLYSDSFSANAVAVLHRELFESLGVGARDRASFERAPLRGRRLKLGLLTGELHHGHSVNVLMQPLLRELDQTCFELFVYYTGETFDAQTTAAKQRSEHWVDARGLNNAQLAARMDEDALDVLVDLAGHAGNAGQDRMGLFAQRAAPVQVAYMGYPCSTGVPNMDYLLGDAIVTPPEADGLCSERVLRLPGAVLCFAPEADYPLPAMTSADAQRVLRFGSFNHASKITKRTLQVWARVLQAVPQSRLVLKATDFGDAKAVEVMKQRMRAMKLDVSRVDFRGPSPMAEMMAEYADVDIALDTLPYNGAATTLQALWMGVPVVTATGTHYASRLGASLITAAGLPEWVAQDDEGYVAIAKAMAEDRKGLLALKRSLRSRVQRSQAWDIAAHTREFEAALVQAALG